VAAIHDATSRVALFVAATDEERAIARATAEEVAESRAVDAPTSIPIAVSARHIHLQRATLEALFGEGYELTPRNPLSQPGQFAAEETLDIIGPKRTIERVRILGPLRPADQVEISRTDEFFLGVDAPVRLSGDIANTPGITLRGPKGTVTLEQGLICAWRHIHMTPADAEAFGVKNHDIVEVAVSGGPRDLIFGDVLVRVKSSYALEMHIDTDEANAAELRSGTPGMLVRTGGEALLTRKARRGVQA
jgi:acetate kinase